MTTFEMNNAVDYATGKIDKYAIYLRKSRADVEAEKLGEGETLTRHKKILTEYAVRKGLYIEKIYQEIVSGETIEARPEIQKLITDCYAGKYRGIIIIEVTRLSRGNNGDAQTIMDCLKYANNNNGLLVITPTKTYDVAHSQEDEEYMEFELFMSRREYKMIQKRMERGRKQAVVEGNYMGSYRPYGYDIQKGKRTRTLSPNKDEAPIVQKIFEWTVNDNMTPGKIARRLDAMGVPTYRGEGEWSLDTVKTILTNPTYCGKVRWNDRMTVKSMIDGKLVSSRPRSNHSDHYMLYDGKHKGIIDEEMFNAAQSRFYSDKTKGNLKLINPLAGILVCQKCQRVMLYQSYKDSRASRYQHPSSQHCKVKSAIASDVLNAVVSSLKLYIEDFEIKLDNLPTVNENTLKSQIEALQREMRKTEKKLSSLFDAWEDRIISDNEFVKRKQLHNSRIEAIKKEMDDLEKSMPVKEEYEEKISSLHEALDALLDDSIDADIKNEYLKNILDKIEYSRENKDEFILDVYLR